MEDILAANLLALKPWRTGEVVLGSKIQLSSLPVKKLGPNTSSETKDTVWR